MSAILYRHIIKRKFKLSTMKIIAIFLLFLLIQKSIGFDEIDSNVWRWRDHRRRCHGRLNLYKDSENHMRCVAIFCKIQYEYHFHRYILQVLRNSGFIASLPQRNCQSQSYGYLLLENLPKIWLLRLQSSYSTRI